MWRATGKLALLVVVSGTSASAVGAGAFYATTGGDLWAIDIPTGAGTRIGSTGYPMVTDLASGPAGEVYGTTGTALIRIDVGTAAATLVGSHGAIPGLMVGLDFSADGTLYGVTQSAGSLVTIDPLTGAAIDVLSISYSSVGDVAVHADCTLYGSFMPGALVRLSPTVGVLRFIGATSRMSGFDFDPASGLLYGFEGTTNQIAVVDLATGALDSRGFGAAPINVFGGTFLEATGCACNALPGGPGPVGNTLRMIRLGDDAILNWAPQPNAVEYSIRRDVMKSGLGLTEIAWTVPTMAVDPAAIPAAGSPFYYQVLPVDCAGSVGPIEWSF